MKALQVGCYCTLYHINSPSIMIKPHSFKLQRKGISVTVYLDEVSIDIICVLVGHF